MGDPDNSFKDINLIVRNQRSSTINWHEKDGFTDHQTNANTFILDYKAFNATFEYLKIRLQQIPTCQINNLLLQDMCDV